MACETNLRREQFVFCCYCLNDSSNSNCNFISDKNDVYERMVKETFNIQISQLFSHSFVKMVCSECVDNFQLATKIKQKVLDVQKTLLEQHEKFVMLADLQPPKEEDGLDYNEQDSENIFNEEFDKDEVFEKEICEPIPNTDSCEIVDNGIDIGFKSPKEENTLDYNEFECEDSWNHDNGDLDEVGRPSNDDLCEVAPPSNHDLVEDGGTEEHTVNPILQTDSCKNNEDTHTKENEIKLERSEIDDILPSRPKRTKTICKDPSKEIKESNLAIAARTRQAKRKLKNTNIVTDEGKNNPSERSVNNLTSSERSVNSRSSSQRNVNKRSPSERSVNSRSSSQRNVNKRSPSERSANNLSPSERSVNNLHSSERSVNNRNSSERSVNNRNPIKQSVNNRSPSKRTVNNLSYTRLNTFNLIINSNMCIFRSKRTKFACYSCNESYLDIRLLREHMKCHSKEDNTNLKINLSRCRGLSYKSVDISNLKCKLCSSPCQDLSDLREHLTKKHEVPFEKAEHLLLPFRLEDGFKCVICHESFFTFCRLSIHMNTHSTSNVCETCGVAYMNRLSLRNHITQTHTEKKCSICSAVFPTTSSRTRHMRIAHNSGAYKRYCMKCEKTFRYNYQLQEHMIKKHGAKRLTVRCEHCEKIFPSECNLRTHVRSVHIGERNFPCSICDMRFFTKCDKKRHERTHGDEYLFSCCLCEVKFRAKDSMKRHLKKQHGKSITNK